MQKGSIRISGKWWYLKVRENVVKNGQTVREIMYHKLAPIDQYRPSSMVNRLLPSVQWQMKS